MCISTGGGSGGSSGVGPNDALTAVSSNPFAIGAPGGTDNQIQYTPAPAPAAAVPAATTPEVATPASTTPIVEPMVSRAPTTNEPQGDVARWGERYYRSKTARGGSVARFGSSGKYSNTKVGTKLGSAAA